MAVTHSDFFIPLASGYPMPSRGYSASDYKLAVRVSADYGIPTPPGFSVRPAVCYFHGSSANDYLSGPLLDGLVSKGYRVISCMALGSGASSVSPYRYGYGNVNAPHFTAHFIKDAWWVESLIQAFDLDDPSSQDILCLLGHSRGAAACLAWAAGYSGRTQFNLPALKGILASGATVAGLGDMSWNDMNRNINTMSGIVNLLKVKTILAYGNVDTYAPPDYARRLQMALPEGVTDKYFVTPGDAPHEWTNSAEYSHYAVMWAEQILTGAVITDKDGNPAISGATMP